jgi:hypothetical protein
LGETQRRRLLWLGFATLYASLPSETNRDKSSRWMKGTALAVPFAVRSAKMPPLFAD